jgi:hypothetical protein
MRIERIISAVLISVLAMFMVQGTATASNDSSNGMPYDGMPYDSTQVGHR